MTANRAHIHKQTPNENTTASIMYRKTSNTPQPPTFENKNS